MTNIPPQQPSSLTEAEKMELLGQVISLVKQLNSLESGEDRLKTLQSSDIFQKLTYEQQDALMNLLKDIFQNKKINQFEITKHMAAILNSSQIETKEVIPETTKQVFLSLLVDLQEYDWESFMDKIDALVGLYESGEKPISNRIALLRSIQFDLEKKDLTTPEFILSISNRLHAAFGISRKLSSSQEWQADLDRFSTEKKALGLIEEEREDTNRKIIPFIPKKNELI